MHSDRKHERKPLSYPGWISADGRPLRPCVIEDASEGGAMLVIDDVNTVPNHFRLLLSPTAQTHRECLVRWRRPGPGHIGLQFAKPATTPSKCVTIE